MMKRAGPYLVTLWLLWLGGGASTAHQERPNIVIIVADDLGWNDVSFHGSNQIPTPNIDALAYDGIILNRHYVPPLCTPSRASLMTGKHPMNIGMQDHVIISDEPWGLGLDQKLMPQYFREAGYRTHLVGKWHLGFFRRAYTPTYRGFDSHFGYLGPYIDYWDHSLQMNETSARGLDMRRNTAVNYDANGTYATDLFNDEAVRLIDSHNRNKPLFLVLTHLAPHTGNEDDPLQAPADEIAKFDYIQDPKRRTLAAMVSRIDTGVGRIYRSLERRRMLNNTIILFYADNGAPTLGIHANSGSNYPLRGQKESPWEGAVRGAALIWSRLLPRKGVVSNQWLHVSDWLPTLGHAAGIRIPPNNSPIDGQNQWSTLTSSSNSGRTVVMNNAHNEFTYSSYIKRGWKYVNGTSFKGAYDRWLGQLKDGEQISHEDYYKRLIASQSIGSAMQLTRDDVKRLRSKAMVECSSAQGTVCEPLKRPCLFNIVEDPCERNNQANAYPYILRELETDVNSYRKRSVPSRQQPPDSRADPARHNGTWTWWLEGLGTQSPTHNLQQLFSTFQSFMEYFMALFAKVEAKLLAKQKYSPWEGAVRGAALIWSPLLPRKRVVSEQWIHVSDWLPTLGHAAGIQSIPAGSPIDGQNQWLTLQSVSVDGRTVVMHNVDHRYGYRSYMKQGWKYINGTTARGIYDGWLGKLSDQEDQISEEDYFAQLLNDSFIGGSMLPSEDEVREIRQNATLRCVEDVQAIPCEPLVKPCLFNVVEDPCERVNLADEYPELLKDLQSDVERFKRDALPPRNQPSDSRSDPALHNNTWTWWQDEMDEQQHMAPYILYLAAAIEILFILIVLWCGHRYCTRSRTKTEPKDAKLANK